MTEEVCVDECRPRMQKKSTVRTSDGIQFEVKKGKSSADCNGAFVLKKVLPRIS